MNSGTRTSWWVHMVPVFVAIIGLIQAVGFLWLGSGVQNTTTAVVGVKEAVVGVEERVIDNTRAVIFLEKQINSNLAKQIQQAINEALARQRLRLMEEDKADAKDKAEEEAKESQL